MTLRFGLFDEGFLVLGVFAVEKLLLAVEHVRDAALGLAAGVDEELGQVEVLARSRDAIELDQADLDLLVAGRIGALAGAELAGDEVGALRGDHEQVLFAGGLIVGRGRFVEMSEVVELVAHVEVRPALLAQPGLGRRPADGAGGIEVAVRLLSRGDLGDQPVDVGRKLGVGVGRQSVRGRLDDLVDVGIVEGIARAVLAVRGPFEGGRGELEILDPAGLLALLEDMRDGHRPVDLQPRRPEGVRQVDVREGHGSGRVIGLGRFGAGHVGRDKKGQGRYFRGELSRHLLPPKMGDRIPISYFSPHYLSPFFMSPFFQITRRTFRPGRGGPRCSRE